MTRGLAAAVAAVLVSRSSAAVAHRAGHTLCAGEDNETQPEDVIGDQDSIDPAWLSWISHTASGPDRPAVVRQTFVRTPLLDRCSCSRAPGGCAKSDQTLVTMLFDIRKPNRSFRNYMHHFAGLLRRFPSQAIVAFVEKAHAEELAARHPRGPDARSLCLIGMSIEELPKAHHEKVIAQIQLRQQHQGFGQNPEFTVPLYDVVTNSKFDLVARSIEQNVFGATRFAWVDGGIHDSMLLHLPADGQVDILTCGDSVCIGFEANWPVMLRSRIDEVSGSFTAAATACNNCAVGTVISGTRAPFLAYAQAFHELVEEYIANGFIDDEQGPEVVLFFRRPGILKDVHCKGFEWCPGYLLGGHASPESADYIFQNGPAIIRNPEY